MGEVFYPSFLDEESRVFGRKQKAVRLNPKQCKLVAAMFENTQKAFTTKELMAILWPATHDRMVAMNLTTFISQLNGKLAHCDVLIDSFYPVRKGVRGRRRKKTDERVEYRFIVKRPYRRYYRGDDFDMRADSAQHSSYSPRRALI